MLHRLRPWPRRQSAVLVVAIAANLAALVYYKYLATIFDVLHIAFTSPVLPLGISFFTFPQIGYLLDCRNGTTNDRSPLNYALFVTFFPHLIAGPIVHNREIMPQFGNAATYRWSVQNVVVGMTIFLLGLLKKCLLADPTSAVVGPGFANPEALTLFPAWHVALSYSLQLYFDFSGYSDMAIGLACMFNVRLPLNFNSPYKAQSVIEYWQRWHMTLTRYLNLCLYDPIALAVRRRRRARGFATTPRGFAELVLFPTFVTMILAGIWHGSGLTFLIFGLLHAIYISVNHAWRMLRPGKPSSALPNVAGRILLTYLCVLVGAIMFRAPSVSTAISLLGSMVGTHGFDATVPDIRVIRDAAWLVALYAIIWGAPNTQQIMADYAPALGRIQAGAVRWEPNMGWAAAFGCAATLGLLSIGGTGEFLYFQF
jgi:alginate O-acetyltransferase complex protein AlgI